MLRLLRSSRWIGFTALVVGAIIAFGLLSHWQWLRAEEKQAAQAQVDSAAAAAPQALGAVAPAEWTPVTVNGSYDASTQVLVRQRPLDGQNGYWVLTALIRPGGDPVWVNRGWLAATGPATTTPPAPAPPAGEVSVTGFWRDPERARSDAVLPVGMVSAADPAVLPTRGTPSGYVQVGGSGIEADPGLTVIPRPESDPGRNISYAVQWLLFAVVAVVGWWYFLRREAADDAAAHAEAEDEVDAARS